MKKILLLATVLIFSCTKSDLDEINSENKTLNAENKKTNPTDSDNTKTNPTDSDNKNMIDGIIFDQSTFEKNRKLWREQKITNYECSYHCYLNAYPMSPVTLIVKNGKINGLRYANTIKKVEDYSNNRLLKTIDEIYNDIEKTAAADKKRAKSRNDGFYTITVKYDSTYHYPISVDYDFKPKDRGDRLIGGDSSITISDFKIKKNNPTDSDNKSMIDGIVFDQSTFEKNRKLWREQKITNYECSYHEFRHCLPMSPITVIVKNRKTYGIPDGIGIIKIEDYWNKQNVQSIDEVYNDIERIATRFKKIAKPTDDGVYTITVNYDSTYHYPTKVDFSLITKDGIDLSDGEGSRTISDLKIKKNNPTDSDNNNMTDVLIDQGTFEKNRKLWREQKIANYEFSFFKMAGHRPSPNLIYTVKNIKFDTVIYKDPNYYNHDKPIGDVYPEYIDTKTIDDLYNYIEKEVADLKIEAKNKDHRSYYTIRVEYDSEYHYPTKIHCDEHHKTMPAPDGGLSTTITIGGFNIK